ncbi:uncharacterized protein LOC133342501 [Lethenteron reissneri]|uniref:uncharacterized protein LOC133342501 n=1 Tax=Lethenteron reissneri TaxID=7753 RepID=UPI002AB6C4D6|nr:uncharacterized protein LOC133342501 [Lethenteron reissneri]
MAEQIESLRAILLSLVTAVASSPAMGRQIADQLDAAGRGVFRSIPASKKKTLRDAFTEMAEFYDPPTSATRKFMSRHRAPEESSLAYRGALMAMAMAAYPNATAEHLDPLILSRMLELSQELNISLPVCGHEPLSSRWVARCLDAKFNIKRWDQMAAWMGKPEIDGPPLGWSPRLVVHCSDDSGDDDMLAAAVPHRVPGRRLRDQRGDYTGRPRARAGSSDRRPTSAACFKCGRRGHFARDCRCRPLLSPAPPRGPLSPLPVVELQQPRGTHRCAAPPTSLCPVMGAIANEDDAGAKAKEDDQQARNERYARRSHSRMPWSVGDLAWLHCPQVQHEHLHYRYEVLKKIGEGGQGQVIWCLDHMRNTLVAVKILVSPLSSKRDKSQRMEIKMALELQGEGSDEDYNVVKVLNHFDFRGHHCIVLELLKESLHDVIKEAGLRQLHMGMVKTYTRGILKFLCHTKARSIIHADIKPENVLIKDTVTGTIRVTDFGTSFFVKRQHRVGMMFCPVKRRVPGSLSLHGALNSQDLEFVEFVSSCLRTKKRDPDCRMTPAQALGHSWLRTTATSTTSNATTTATPGSVQCFGAAERRAEPALPPSSALAQASKWLTVVVEEEETPVEELVVQEEETLVEERVVQEEEETLVEELLVQEEETLVEELVVQEEEETLVEELVVQEEETLVEELLVQEEETLVEELVVQEEETLVEEVVVQEETLVEELLVQEEETLVEELVVQEEETLVEELLVQEEETLVEELVVQEEETLVEELVVQEEKTLVEELVVQEEETLVEELVVQEEEEMRGETEEVWTKEQEEEMVVQVEETLVEKMVEKEMTRKEDQVMQEEKRKPGSLARIGRTIRSLLRRVLLCGGRSTTQ